jgi:hypothetical protein
MKPFYFLQLTMFVIVSTSLSAQTNIFPSTGAAGIGITSPDPSSLFDVVSTTKGILIPRMTLAQRNAIAIPSTGLLIYQTNSTPGFYYYNGSAWSAISTKGANTSLSNLKAPTAINESLLPNASATFDIGSSTLKWRDTYTGSVKFSDGTMQTTASPWVENGSNIYFNGAIGIGVSSPVYKLDILGDINLASGNVLRTGGITVFKADTANIAVGKNALLNNTTGYSNVAIGKGALFKNTKGNGLVAIGDSALFNQVENDETVYYYNTAIGYQTLFSNRSGDHNTATGFWALYHNTTGYLNTANGSVALENNTTGNDNTAIGDEALTRNNGDDNTAIGVAALLDNTNGLNNTAAGSFAGYYVTSGSNNTFLGNHADCSGQGQLTNSTAIGYNASVLGNNKVVVGNSFITSIGGFVNWSNLSDGRYKQNIKQNVPGLAFINKLNPVTYTLNINAIESKLHEGKKEMKTPDGKTLPNPKDDPIMKQAMSEKSKIIYTGFVAQDVEKAAKELNYDFSGVDKPQDVNQSFYGLRYADFVVPLVKAVQELSSQNEKLKNENDDLEQRVSKLEALMNVSQSTVNGQQSTANSSASLSQNIPNPFNRTTTINYSLPQQFSSAKIIVTDNPGKVLKEINVIGAGKNSVQVNASILSAGAYNYSLYIDGRLIDTKKMMLTK